MRQRLYRPFLAVLLVLLAISSGTVLAQAGEAQLRFVHAIPGASPVDVYIDGELSARNIALGSASNYIQVTAGAHQIAVTLNGTTSPLWEQSYSPGAGKAYTLVASSVEEPITFTAFEDLLEPLPLGRARFTAIHTVADAGAIDVILDDGRPLVLGQTYNTPYGTLDIPVFSYNLAVTASGGTVEDAILQIDQAALNTGTSYMLLLYGRAANPQFTLLSTPTRASADTDGFLKLVYAAADPSSATVSLTGEDGTATLVASVSAEDGGSTGYFALPSGSYDVEVQDSDTQESILTDSISITSNEYSTALIGAAGDMSSLSLLSDNLAGLGPDEALIRVTNVAGEDTNVSASLANGVIIANNLAAGSSSETTSTAPGTMSLIVSETSAGMSTLPEQDFYGGVFYDVLALGDSVLVNEAAIAQGLSSAPGDAMLVAAEPTAVAVEPTLAPAAPADATVAPPAPTAIPEATIAPVIVPAAAQITGRVFNLNVDANLQLRQYPHSNALSLGTVPFGTILIVNGRAGAIEDIPFSPTQIPPDYSFVDPIALLADDDEDLVPSETWLNVLYNTPDGGTIEAWTRADFVDVRDEDGEKLPLRELDTVASNLPGEAQNTDLTPPPIPEDVVTVTVINLEPTANLNVRRTPETLGEVLAQIPLGTSAEFVGIDSEEGEWVFLTYTGADGSTVNGWSSINFLEFAFNGRDVDLAELAERGLLTTVDISRRGNQTVGAAPVVAATVDPTVDAVVAEVALDPGANLNLRRTPDVGGEVLAPVPSGSRLIVTERTSDAQWLHVTYEGVDGWVAAQTDTAVFVVLSFNGAPYEIEDVPVALGA